MGDKVWTQAAARGWIEGDGFEAIWGITARIWRMLAVEYDKEAGPGMAEVSSFWPQVDGGLVNWNGNYKERMHWAQALK